MLKQAFYASLTVMLLIALNGSEERLSFKGNGWNNGVGVSAQISSHTLFIEADMVDGNRFNQRQVNAGYRFSF